ncbi:MAG: hypothetical protein WAV23_00520 [Minisyncoccia bacterium]
MENPIKIVPTRYREFYSKIANLLSKIIAKVLTNEFIPNYLVMEFDSKDSAEVAEEILMRNEILSCKENEKHLHILLPNLNESEQERKEGTILVEKANSIIIDDIKMPKSTGEMKFGYKTLFSSQKQMSMARAEFATSENIENVVSMLRENNFFCFQKGLSIFLFLSEDSIEDELQKRLQEIDNIRKKVLKGLPIINTVYRKTFRKNPESFSLALKKKTDCEKALKRLKDAGYETQKEEGVKTIKILSVYPQGNVINKTNKILTNKPAVVPKNKTIKTQQVSSSPSELETKFKKLIPDLLKIYPELVAEFAWEKLNAGKIILIDPSSRGVLSKEDIIGLFKKG